MRQNLCLVVVLCLLPFPLGANSMPPDGDSQSQMSAVPSPEPEKPTRGSNSSDTDEGGGRLRLSLPGIGEQDGKPVFALHKVEIPEVEASENAPSRMVVSSFLPDDDHSTGRLLVAVARTLVTTTASTTTVTVLTTCFVGTPAALALLMTCTGKRRRRLIPFNAENSEAGLDSSIASGSVLVYMLNERSGRFILWSSSVTTVTIRTTSLNTLIRVTADFPCSAPGLVACVPG